MADLNHRIAKAIVNSRNPGDRIVMEDLRCIRERIRAAKEQRLIQHSWGFRVTRGVYRIQGRRANPCCRFLR